MNNAILILLQITETYSVCRIFPTTIRGFIGCVLREQANHMLSYMDMPQFYWQVRHRDIKNLIAERKRELSKVTWISLSTDSSLSSSFFLVSLRDMLPLHTWMRKEWSSVHTLKKLTMITNCGKNIYFE